MLIMNFSLIALLILMAGSSSSELPAFSQAPLPFYSDEENSKKIKEKAKGNKEILKAYDEANANKTAWAKTKVDEYVHDNVDHADLALGTMYSMKDFRVKKTYEKDLQVQGGTVDVIYHPINPTERIKMSKTYRTVHLDGLQINCESLMPRGSEGFAIMTLYDERFISQEKGFLGLIGFPLGVGVSKATLKVNYSISTFDTVNWVAIITVYDHNLRDDMRPCNFHMKAFYKYTNNVSRFLKNEADTEVGSFKIKIKNDKKGFAEESIRNSLDYSMSILTNKKFMNKLSERELKCLKRSDSAREENVGRQIPNFGDSCRHSFAEEFPLYRDKGRFSNFEATSSKFNENLSELKIDFEMERTDEEKKAFLIEQLNALTMKGKFIPKPNQLEF